MKKSSLFPFAAALTIFVPCDAAEKAAAADPSKVDADYASQGEYTGTIQGEGELKLGAQVIALGKGKFRVVAYMGGLPGDGWDGSEKTEIESEIQDGRVTFVGENATGVVHGGKMIVKRDGQEIGVLERIIRKSPTLGKKPPNGAVVLFDGTSADNFKPGSMTEEGLLKEGANSKRRFQSQRLHIEFRLPYEPTKRGQGRANSGCYLQGRYEVQMLDSFGLAGKHNECGGIYTIKDPDVNMCFPPLTWQTYDIDFTAAKFGENGKKNANSRMTVRHNGVVIHNNIELPHSTTASPLKEGSEPGFLHLQNHGNPVRYRNIWVLEK